MFDVSELLNDLKGKSRYWRELRTEETSRAGRTLRNNCSALIYECISGIEHEVSLYKSGILGTVEPTQSVGSSEGGEAK